MPPALRRQVDPPVYRAGELETFIKAFRRGLDTLLRFHLDPSQAAIRRDGPRLAGKPYTRELD